MNKIAKVVSIAALHRDVRPILQPRLGCPASDNTPPPGIPRLAEGGASNSRLARFSVGHCAIFGAAHREFPPLSFPGPAR
jgi:hypothetical protein